MKRESSHYSVGVAHRLSFTKAANVVQMLIAACSQYASDATADVVMAVESLPTPAPSPSDILYPKATALIESQTHRQKMEASSAMAQILVSARGTAEAAAAYATEAAANRKARDVEVARRNQQRQALVIEAVDAAEVIAKHGTPFGSGPNYYGWTAGGAMAPQYGNTVLYDRQGAGGNPLVWFMGVVYGGMVVFAVTLFCVCTDTSGSQGKVPRRGPSGGLPEGYSGNMP